MMYDNPVAWGVLAVISLICAFWFGKKCLEEMDKNIKEQYDFWANEERKKNEK